jgi:UDP-glucose 4-epimerase
MQALITGGAGFVGSHLAERVVRAGHRVRVLDNLSAGNWDNLSVVAGDTETIEGDVRDAAAVATAVAGCDVIFHLAAVNSVPRSFEDPELVADVNTAGSACVLAAATRADVGRVVLASSSSVYGAAAAGRRREDMAPTPLSPYGASKLAAEELCMRAKIETVVLRYFNVFGPRQPAATRYAAAVPRFIAACLDGEPITIFGSGEQVRDFTFVEDTVEATVLAADASLDDRRRLNVGTGRATTLNELAELVQRVTGRRAEVRHAPARPGDVDRSVAHIGAARAVLGYAPRVPLEDGLLRALRQHEAPRASSR